MKTAVVTVTLLALLTSAGAQANCRVAYAAKAGGDAGLARDQAAATTAADTERTNSDTLGKCITSITSITVVPTFPSLTDIFNAAATKMCRLAGDAIPRVPPIVLGTGIPLPAGSLPIPAPLPLPGNPRSAAPPSDLWSKIWR